MYILFPNLINKLFIILLFICTDLAQLLYLYFPETDKKQLSSSFEVSLEGQQGPDVYVFSENLKEISKDEKKTE